MPVKKNILIGFDINEKFILNPVIYCACKCGNTKFEFCDSNRRLSTHKTKYILGHGSRGENNGMYGKEPWSKGIKMSDEIKKKLSINKFKFYAEGGKNPMLGRKHSEETKQKMSNSWYNSDKSYGYENSKPERFLKSILSVNGIEYESQKKIYGKPDIFIQPNICIFVDGCFYHGCKQCCTEKQLRCKDPIRKMKRDPIVNQKLIAQGYKVIRFWQHEINNDLKLCLYKILEINNG